MIKEINEEIIPLVDHDNLIEKDFNEMKIEEKKYFLPQPNRRST